MNFDVGILKVNCSFIKGFKALFKVGGECFQ